MITEARIRPPGTSLRVLGLDTGHTTGVAILEADADGRVQCLLSAVYRCPPDRGDQGHPGDRYRAWSQWYRRMQDTWQPHIVAYERIVRPQGFGSQAAQGSAGGFERQVLVDTLMPVVPVHVSSAKKRLTGNGRATKAMMSRSAAALFSRFSGQHDAADAIAVGLVALDLLSEWRCNLEE